MAVIFVPRFGGGTLILEVNPSPPLPIPTLEVTAVFRSGTITATYRDGEQRATYRDGVVKARGR